MRKLMPLVSVFVALLWSIAAMAADAPDIAGTLLDANGAPVGNAPVSLYFCEFARGTVTGRTIGQVNTDSEGKFRFEKAFVWTSKDPGGPMPPRYSLVATPSGQGPAYLNLQQDEKSDDVQLRAAAREVLPVSVVDAEGKPVADARVWLLMATQGENHEPGRILTLPPNLGLGERTNADGKVDLIVPPAGLRVVAAEKTGYATGLGEGRITLSQGGTVGGRVFGMDGKPVAGAKVTYSTNVMAGYSLSTATTNSLGMFKLDNVPGEGHLMELRGSQQTSNGQVTITASLPEPSSESGSATVMLKPGQTVMQDINVKASLKLAGTLVDPVSGEGVKGIRLRMHSYPRAGGRADSQVATTDEGGRFSFSVSANSHIQIEFEQSGDGYLVDDDAERRGRPGFTSQGISESKTDLKLTVKLRKLAPLMGKVVDPDGKPVANASVSVHPQMRPAQTDAEGAFAFKGAPTDRAGQVTVTTDKLGAVAPLAAGQAQVTVTAMPLVERDCIVTTPEGQPANDLRFVMMMQTGPRGRSFTQASNVRFKTDAEGKCRLSKLIPGATYMANWSPEGDYSHGSARVEVQGSDAPVRFTAPKYNNSFGIIVENEDGEGVKGAQIQLRNMSVVRNDKWAKYGNLQTDAEGAVRIDGIAGGIVEFEIYAPGYRRHQAEVASKDGEYLATLTREDSPPRHIVVIRSADGKPVADQPVRSFTRGAETQLKTDANGRIEMPVYDRPTDVLVLCEHPELGWGVANLEWYQDGTKTMIVRKPAAPRKVRLVTVDGKPVANTAIFLSSLADRLSSETNGGIDQASFYSMPESLQNELGLKQVTDENGMVTFPRADSRLSAGLRITSREYGEQHKNVQENGSTDGDEIQIQKLGKIAGALIYPPDSGIQPNQYHVEAMPVDAMGGGQGASVKQDGWFEMSVEPGEYRIRATSYGQNTKYLVRDRPVVKVGPGETKEVDLELKAAIPVRGKFIAKGGAMPEPPLKIAVQIDDNMGIRPQTINADGTFEFYVPAPGEYTVMVEMRGQRSNYRHYATPIKVPGEQPVEGIEVKEE